MNSTSTTSAAAAEFTKDAALDDQVPAHHASPAVAFIIGLAIILLASILNAAGLNLTKLDHVSVIARLVP
jgi:magnesium transporter